MNEVQVSSTVSISGFFECYDKDGNLIKKVPFSGAGAMTTDEPKEQSDGSDIR